MFGFLTPARRELAGPLASAAEADHFWRSVAAERPAGGQKSISEALADLVLQKELEPRAAPRACWRSTSGRARWPTRCSSTTSTRNAQAQPFERRYWRAAARAEPVVRRRRSTTCCVTCATTRARAAGANTRPRSCCGCSATGRSNSCCGRSSTMRRFPETWAELHCGLPVRGGPGVVAPSDPRQGRPRTPTRREHAAEGIRAHPAARADERRAVLARTTRSGSAAGFPTGTRSCRCKADLVDARPRRRTTSSSISTAPKD